MTTMYERITDQITTQQEGIYQSSISLAKLATVLGEMEKKIEEHIGDKTHLHYSDIPNESIGGSFGVETVRVYPPHTDTEDLLDAYVEAKNTEHEAEIHNSAISQAIEIVKKHNEDCDIEMSLSLIQALEALKK